MVGQPDGGTGSQGRIRAVAVKAALIAAALILAGLLAWGIWAWNVTHFHLGYWLQVHTGTVNEAGPYYGFFSGFGSDLSEIALLGGFAVIVRRFNCHTSGCWRVGRFHLAGSQFLVCSRHHREVTGTPKKLTPEVLKEAHAEHLDRITCDHGPVAPGG